MKSAIICILISPLLLMAQQNGVAWTNIGPGPAAVEAIAIDPQGTGTIFVGTIAGGVRKSIDNGSTWSVINSGLTSPIVHALAIDASGPQTIYAGAEGGAFKSVDGGATWKNLPAISGAVASIAADPKRAGVVYAAAFNNLANGSIRKSVDAGVTWTTAFPTTAAIFNIAIDPSNTDVIYAPTVGHGAFMSTDGGSHWSAITTLTPQAIWAMAVDPANSQVIYAGTNQDGIWKSTDAGNTWQQTGSLGPFPVYWLAVDSSAAHLVYAGTNGGGVLTSADGGATWKSTGLASGMVLSLAVDSTGVLYAGTGSAGAQASRDHGASWTVMNTGLDRVNKFSYGIWIDPSHNQKILVGDEDMYGLISSPDGGATWSAVGQGFTGRGSRGVAFDPTNAQRVYAGALSGIGFFKSTDGGLTWSARRFGSSAVYVIAVAVDPSSPNVVYVGTQNEGPFKSTDYGDTWASAGTGLSGAITYLTVDPSEGGRLFASTATAFYLSEDGGVTWTNVLNSPAWTVTIDAADPSRVYATARTQGVFRSSDGGHTWQSINSGLTSLTMGRSAPIIIDPTNRQTLYVGSEGGGVSKSLDGGDHWFAVNSGLSDLSVMGLAMDPAEPSVLYACGPSGVFKTLMGAETQTASIAISAILNGASSLQAPVSPGEIVVITGSGLGPAELTAATAANGLYSTQLSGTTVRFNAIPAPLIYTSATQVAVQVPNMFLVSQAQVTITFEGRTSAPFPIQVAGSSPGVFTLDSTGKGQAVALNQDDTVNTASNPAKVGDVIALFVTGLRQSDAPVTVTIGGGAVIVASTKDSSPGVLEIDARIPSGIQTGNAVPVVVQVGNTPSQAGVAIAVQSATPAGAAMNTAIGLARAVTTDPAGNVYLVSSNSVFKVDSKGVLTILRSVQAAEQRGPLGVR